MAKTITLKQLLCKHYWAIGKCLNCGFMKADLVPELEKMKVDYKVLEDAVKYQEVRIK